MDIEKVATKFVMKLNKRLGVAIHPEVEMQLIGEIVSLMKSAQYEITKTKTDARAGKDFIEILNQQIKK